MVVACASGTSAGDIVGGHLPRRTGKISFSFSISTAMRAASPAGGFEQQRQFRQAELQAGLAWPAFCATERARFRRERAEFHLRMGIAGIRISGRAPAWACPRRRNRSGWPRSPARCRAWARAGKRRLPASRNPRRPRPARGARRAAGRIRRGRARSRGSRGEQRQRTRVVERGGERI